MSYEEMWFLLKRTVKEDYDIYSNKSRLSSYSEVHKGLAGEADYILDQMEIMEVREKMLREKEKCEAKNEDH